MIVVCPTPNCVQLGTRTLEIRPEV